MKILFLGRFNSRSPSPSQADGFEKNGCEVIRYDYYINDGSNHQILEIAERERPDFIFVSKGELISDGIIRKCNAIAPCILWFMDSPDKYIEHPDLLFKVTNCKYVFVAGFEPYELLWAVKGNNVHYLREGFDHIYHYPEKLPKIHNITFVGDHKKHNRTKIISAVQGEVFEELFQNNLRQLICSSKINLNLTYGAGGTSDRLYKIMACGGFALSEDYPGRELDFEDGKHLVIFYGIEDLKEKTRYYLDHPDEREAIATAGHLKVQPFSRIKFAEYILKVFQEGK